MTSRRSNGFVVCRQSDRREILAVNVPFGNLGSSGRIKRFDCATLGYGEEPAVGRPDNGSDWIRVVQLVLDGDELVTTVTVEDVDGVFAGSGDVAAVPGELDSLDDSVVLEWANQSLPSRDAPDARFPHTQSRWQTWSTRARRRLHPHTLCPSPRRPFSAALRPTHLHPSQTHTLSTCRPSTQKWRSCPFPFAFPPLGHLQLAIVESQLSSRRKNAFRQGGERASISHHQGCHQQPLLSGLIELSALYNR
jgi:hypothetical protein